MTPQDCARRSAPPRPPEEWDRRRARPRTRECGGPIARRRKTGGQQERPPAQTARPESLPSFAAWDTWCRPRRFRHRLRTVASSSSRNRSTALGPLLLTTPLAATDLRSTAGHLPRCGRLPQTSCLHRCRLRHIQTEGGGPYSSILAGSPGIHAAIVMSVSVATILKDGGFGFGVLVSSFRFTLLPIYIH